MALNRTVGGTYNPPAPPQGSDRSDTTVVPDDIIRGRVTSPNLTQAVRNNYIEDAFAWTDAVGFTLIVSVLPTPTEDYQGRFLTVEGAPGSRDRTYICLKSDSDTFSWVEVANGGA